LIDLRLGDVMRTMPDRSVHTCVTSPPYFGLRDYGADGQIGLEATPDAFVAKMVEVFREVLSRPPRRRHMLA
jgi:DNA modification methylase